MDYTKRNALDTWRPPPYRDSVSIWTDRNRAEGGTDEHQSGSGRSSVRHRAGVAGSGPAGQARQGHLPDLLRREGAGAVRARRGDAAFLLVHGGAQGFRWSPATRSELRDRVLGPRGQLPRELAGGGAVAERHDRGVRGAGQGACERGEDPA